MNRFCWTSGYQLWSSVSFTGRQYFWTGFQLRVLAKNSVDNIGGSILDVFVEAQVYTCHPNLPNLSDSGGHCRNPICPMFAFQTLTRCILSPSSVNATHRNTRYWQSCVLALQHASARGCYSFSASYLQQSLESISGKTLFGVQKRGKGGLIRYLLCTMYVWERKERQFLLHLGVKTLPSLIFLLPLLPL